MKGFLNSTIHGAYSILCVIICGSFSIWWSVKYYPPYNMKRFLCETTCLCREISIKQSFMFPSHKNDRFHYHDFSSSLTPKWNIAPNLSTFWFLITILVDSDLGQFTWMTLHNKWCRWISISTTNQCKGFLTTIDVAASPWQFMWNILHDNHWDDSPCLLNLMILHKSVSAILCHIPQNGS